MQVLPLLQNWVRCGFALTFETKPFAALALYAR